MTCDRCERLEEEVAYLRSELGEMTDSNFVSNIKLGFNVTPGAAKLAELLYRANGRLVSKDRLSDLLGVEGHSNVVSVYLSMLRKNMGREAFSASWGAGIGMTEAGRLLVEGVQPPSFRAQSTAERIAQ